MNQRRLFSLKMVSVTIGLVLISALQSANAAEPDAKNNSLKSKPDVVIYEGVYPGWPWVCAGADGTLYCVFREGVRHMFSAEGKIMLSLSHDQGKSWSKAKAIIDEPGVDDRNVAITELKNKKLLLVYNTYSADKKSQTYGCFSTDGGATWSRRMPIGPAETRTRAAVVELSNGSLVLPFYVAPGNGTLAARSIDGGNTWKTVRISDTHNFVGDEWDLMEVSPGRLIGLIRNSHKNRKGLFWVTESRNFGKSWSVPKKTNIQSQRHSSPAAMAMQNNTPTVIYPDRRMVSVAATSTNDPNFVTWKVAIKLPCYQYESDGTAIRDGSYLSSVSLGKHRRLLVDYEIRENSKRITGYFVDFPTDW